MLILKTKQQGEKKEMAKKRPPSMDYELLEYIKFLHLHGLVDVIPIIESIPIFYQTQIKKFNINNVNDVESVNNNSNERIDNGRFNITKSDEYVSHQKYRLQNLTFIACKLLGFKFKDINMDFPTWRIGPFSPNLENECNNLIYSNIFNNAISSKKTFAKRYNIASYDKPLIITNFSNVERYRDFLSIVENKHLKQLSDLAIAIDFHLYFSNPMFNSKKHLFYKKSIENKVRLIRKSLRGLVSWHPDRIIYENYINELIFIVFKLFYKNDKDEDTIHRHTHGHIHSPDKC